MPEPKYNYKDVFIYPQYSEISSRTLVDTSTKIFDNLTIDVPVISSNMDTITESAMAIAMAKAGGLGALHRFCQVHESVEMFKYTKEVGVPVLVSIGVNGDCKERAAALYKAGARFFIVDVAHGHHKQVGDVIKWLRREFKDIRIMAGDVATPEGVAYLIDCGANSVKIGIGPGNVCLTKNVTGVTVPQFSALKDCCSSYLNGVSFIADGGITEIGDIAKALGARASAVMCGRFLAPCIETCGPYLNGKKVYRGMASLDSMRKIRDEDSLPTPEGMSIVIDEPSTTADKVVKHIKGGLQSAFSYCNAKNLTEFQKNAIFGVKYSSS